MARVALTFIVLAAACGADWPTFRGPDGNGVAPSDAVPPTKWDETSGVAWAIDIPGEGWSAPIVVGDRVLLTTAVPDAGGALRFEVRCYALADGAERWVRAVRTAAPSQPKHQDNTFASETPASDGKSVFAYFGMNGLYALSLEGAPLWEAEPGSYAMDNDWGTSSAPVLAGGNVVLQIDSEEGSFVVAYDAQSGKEAWRVARPGERSSWSSPVVWASSVREEVVLGGATVRSYAPATGAELWSMEIGGRSSATAAAVGDVLYIGSEDRSDRGGTPGGLFAVKAGATGAIDVTRDGQPGLVWANLRGAVGIASPVVREGLIYVPERRGGVLRTHDAATGAEVGRTRVRGAGVFWASPLSIGGRVYLTDERGVTVVLAPGPDAEVLHTNPLPGRFWSTPAVAGDAILLRSDRKLYCVRSGNGA